mmetsp:Transcript_43846/g.103683  ORF Transcript_43846/g.103683 Transcript_43846/m.103683 type:complete len:188 (+) Transcript_43846:123-686(+)
MRSRCQSWGALVLLCSACSASAAVSQASVDAKDPSMLTLLSLAGNHDDKDPDATKQELLSLDSNTDVVSEDQANSDSARAEEKAARTFAEFMAEHEQKTEKARVLTEKAASLRQKASNMARSAEQRALRAGVDATQKKADSILASITKLQKEATDKETKAASLRARSQAEQTEARNLMTVSRSALEQ